MKKYFLTLMTCASFLVPASGFCMEKEEDYSKNSLRGMPKDVQLVILEKLTDGEDLVSMKRVSSDFCALVKETKKKIIPIEIVFSYPKFLSTNQYWAGRDYDRADFTLFLEAQNFCLNSKYYYKKELISLGSFTINGLPDTPVSSKKAVLLPQSVEKGIFLADMAPRFVDRDFDRQMNNPLTHTELGGTFRRFYYNNDDLQMWDHEKYAFPWEHDAAKEAYFYSPSIISDNTEVKLEIKIVSNTATWIDTLIQSPKNPLDSEK